MNFKERRKKWADALRSGKYIQGLGRLRDMDDRFCCLGVACDIHSDGEWNDAPPNCDDVSYWIYEVGPGFGSRYSLPNEIREYYGLDENTVNHLVALNDGNMQQEQESFAVIADFIENIGEDNE